MATHPDLLTTHPYLFIHGRINLPLRQIDSPGVRLHVWSKAH